MITAVHRNSAKNASACGRVAFYYDEDGAPMDVIQAERVTLPDGSNPQPGDTMICGSCGAEIGPAALDLLPGEHDVRVKP